MIYLQKSILTQLKVQNELIKINKIIIFEQFCNRIIFKIGVLIAEIHEFG
jgi:hypothetical protein